MNRTEMSPYGRLCWATSAVSAGVVFTGLLLEQYYLAGAGLFWLVGFGMAAYIEFLKTFPDPDADTGI